VFPMDVFEQQWMIIGGSLLCAGIGSVTDVRERMRSGPGLKRICQWRDALARRGALSIYHGRLRETLGNVVAVLQHHGRHGLKPHPDLTLSNARTLRLPFALPIAAGWLYTLCSVAWEARS